MTTDERIWAWIRDHTYAGSRYPLLVKRLQAIVPHDRIPDVLGVISDTCEHCHDGDADCQCWNDE